MQLILAHATLSYNQTFVSITSISALLVISLEILSELIEYLNEVVAPGNMILCRTDFTPNFHGKVFSTSI